MLVKKLFAFSFGGNNDFSRIFKTSNAYHDSNSGDILTINFPKESPTGYGIAIRLGIDTAKNMVFKKGLLISHCSTIGEVPVEINLTIQFKIKDGIIADSVDMVVSNFGNFFEIPDLDDELKEIVLFISKYNNPELACKLQIQKLELVKS